MTDSKPRFFKFSVDGDGFARWPGVKPGDLVQSPFTEGWHFRDRGQRRDNNTISFRYNPLLVIAKVDGPPDDSPWPFKDASEVVTFMCLHPKRGIVFILKERIR